MPHREDHVELGPGSWVDGSGRQRLEEHRFRRLGVAERGPVHLQGEAVPPGGPGRAEPDHVRRHRAAVMPPEPGVGERLSWSGEPKTAAREPTVTTPDEHTPNRTAAVTTGPARYPNTMS